MKKLILLVLIFLLAACTGATQSETSRYREKWERAGVSHYRFELFIACFCAFGRDMPLVIEVNDGKIVSMEYKSGNPLPEHDREYFERFATIDRIFLELESDAIKEADEVTVTYDETYGFPTQINIDYIKDAVDDELGLILSGFEVLP